MSEYKVYSSKEYVNRQINLVSEEISDVTIPQKRILLICNDTS